MEREGDEGGEGVKNVEIVKNINHDGRVSEDAFIF